MNRAPAEARAERDTSNPASGHGCHPDERRCLCGSLLARRVPGGVEIKCRRCKRSVVLALHDDER